MVITFDKRFVPLILSGIKTQTRRIWRHGPKVKEGRIYQARVRRFDPPFAMLKVKRVWRQKLGEMTNEEARAEGFVSRLDFVRAFIEINRLSYEWAQTYEGYYYLIPPETFEMEVWAVEFEVTEILPNNRSRCTRI